MKRFYVFIAIVLLMIVGIQNINAQGWQSYRRNFLYDVQNFNDIKLDSKQKELAQYAFLFYFTKFGYKMTEKMKFDDAVRMVTDDQYGEILIKAGKFSQSKAAMAAMNTGLWGEKFIKALLITAETAWSTGREWVEDSSKSYDKTH